jgi:hypothetical protein
MHKTLLVLILLISLALHAEAQKVPPDKELKTLVRDSLLAFNDGVQQKSFAGFHKHELATLFRDQMPLEKFTSVFQSFFEKGYDIADIKQSTPVFDEPAAIDSDGVLSVKGSYPTRPNKVTFKLKYIQEKSAWKLLGINVQIVPFVEKPGALPSEAEAKQLALDSLLAFNKAVQRKSFDSFYTEIAKLWQAQTTAAKLTTIFQPFINKGAAADFSAIAKLEPTFDAKPTIDEDNFLALKGSYPTQPSKLFFDLRYLYEEGTWKLVAINVNLKQGTDKPTTDKALKKPDSDDDE